MRFTVWPYYGLGQPPTTNSGNWAVFFGADFYNMTEIDLAAFVAKTNECLEYVRRHCPGCQLIYRPHPDENSELDKLNLAGFSLQRDEQSAEAWLWANQKNIRYVFSVCSTSSLAGFNLGLNSYAFYRYFTRVFYGVHKIFVDKYFSELPKHFFITDLNQPPEQNRLTLQPDSYFISELENILAKHTGPVWFIVTENRFMLAIEALSRLIKNYASDRPVNLVIARHQRWTDQVLGELAAKFDQVLVYPRHFYSLKLAKLFSAWRTAREIKKLSVDPESILIGFAYHNFIENCFLSYNPKVYAVAAVPKNTWEINFRTEQSGFNLQGTVINKAVRFYNHFFEPWLGLYKTFFRQYPESGLFFIRPQQSLEELYDQVFIFTNIGAAHFDRLLER